MPRRLQRFSPRLAAAFVLCLVAVFAQDVPGEFGPGVMRVGAKLACRCGTCRNSVADCPMTHCESASPMRQRVAQMLGQGMKDDEILSAIVKQEGIVALAAPPAVGSGLLAWIMPAAALLIGFFIYQGWVRRNRKPAAAVSAEDQALIDRYREQMDREIEP